MTCDIFPLIFEVFTILFSYRLLTFPPQKGGILVTTVDYLGLGDEELINDAIIEFYIK
jgi:Ulp1 family protease